MHLASAPWQAASLPCERWRGARAAMGRLSFLATTKAPCEPANPTWSRRNETFSKKLKIPRCPESLSRTTHAPRFRNPLRVAKSIRTAPRSGIPRASNG